MRILAIETSCDETAIAILEAEGDFDAPKFKVLSHNLYSQASKHAEFGGVYPNLAKREHGLNLTPLLRKTLLESGLLKIKSGKSKVEIPENIEALLNRNPELLEQVLEFVPTLEAPNIDAIVVTEGPGLEPALWVGINFAQALGSYWDKPVIGINHMEGHIYSVLVDEVIFKEKTPINELSFPALALLISGGHTELVLVKDWGEYELLGQTRDDAVGEAFDKTARVLGLPYPGGPQISKLDRQARDEGLKLDTSMPRPMIHSGDLDFSFSGLKTAVLYYEKEHGPLSNDDKKKLAREVEEAISEVLTSKTRQALLQSKARTLIIGGGVINDRYLQSEFKKMIKEEFPHIKLLLPTAKLSTDNAIMIGMAGYFKILEKGLNSETLTAQGALRLAPQT